MTSHRRWPLLTVILALSVGVSCTTSDGGPTEASLEASSQTPASFSTAGPVETVSISANLLACSPQRYIRNTALVGPKGGKIKVGSHVLRIPAGALSQDVTIVAEQITGLTNSVRFSPEGLSFATAAELTMSYTNCAAVGLPKSIVYTSEGLGILELLKSDDKYQTKIVTSPIDHFSRYAVAY
jgi:hypothetical protein